MTWEVNLGADQPNKRYVALAAACLSGFVGLAVLKSAGLALVGFGLIIVSTAELFFKVKFKLTEEAASSQCAFSHVQLRWTDVRSIWQDSEGIKLSPLPKGSRMESFRGVYLRFANNREAVLAKIAEHWDGDPTLLGRGADAGANGGASGEGSE